MTFAPYLEHSAPIFKSLELLPIEKVFINRVAIVMLKITCDMLPETMAKLYSKNKDYHAHDTRGKNLLRIPAVQNFFHLIVLESGMLYVAK